MIFWLPNFGGLWLTLNVVLFQAVFHFAFIRGYVFISNWGGKWWRLGAAFLIPFRVPGGCVHWVISFVLYMSAMASPVGWCLCQWVGWGVSGVVGGSRSSAFDYLDFSMDSTLVWTGV